jgi:hypothetical protein
MRFSSADVSYFLMANAIVLGLVAYAYALQSGYPDFYYLTVQEDEYLEWSSFWAFFLAAGAFIRRATGFRRTTRAFPWFLYGVALFCFIVAMEEISWGQRLFGYRPPVYFLEYNFQQELNFHNVIETDYRKLALTLVIAGYGIALPVLARFTIAHDWFRRLGIVAPSVALLPAFAAAFVVYVWYPWSHSGEWVELMLGLGFLFSAARISPDHGDERKLFRDNRFGPATITAIVSVAVFGLGLVSAAVTRGQRGADPANMQAAKTEAEAIANDFTSGLVSSRCNLHKRLYTFVVEYDQPELFEGRFSRLQSQGLPTERAEFFLDPWNSPYWIRDRCDRENDTRISFVYSFGPNRRRDSSRTEILGDDIGSYFSRVK